MNNLKYKMPELEEMKILFEEFYKKAEEFIKKMKEQEND